MHYYPTTIRAGAFRLLAFLNPLHNPCIPVVAVLTFLEEVGQHDAWYLLLGWALLDLLAVQLLCWATVQTVGNRRLWHWLLVGRHHECTPQPARTPATRRQHPLTRRARPSRTDWIWHRGNWRASIYIPASPPRGDWGGDPAGYPRRATST
jgi:hypothetical protein